MSHVLRFDSVVVEDREADPLLNEVKRFWEVESVGCQESEPDTVQKKFKSEIVFENGRYEVKMPFKEEHPVLPDNFSIAKTRLNSLVKRLKENPKVAKEYDNVIKEQLQ